MDHGGGNRRRFLTGRDDHWPSRRPAFAVSRLRLSRSSLFYQRRAAHLRDPRVLPDRPLLSDHAQLWALRYALGGNCSASDFRFAFRHPDFAAIRELNTARIG
jgi:hypothetical protein